MNIITIQKGNPYIATIVLTSNGLPYDLTGTTVFFTVKLVNDFASNDTNAIITENITTHVPPASAGVTTLDLSTTQTNVPTGEYKGDFRVYLGGVIQANTETFKVVVTDIVTKRIV